MEVKLRNVENRIVETDVRRFSAEPKAVAPDRKDGLLTSAATTPIVAADVRRLDAGTRICKLSLNER
jgi:hypothetical protein